MQIAFFALFAAAIVAADQFTKFLTVANIALGGKVPFIPGLIRFTYVSPVCQIRVGHYGGRIAVDQHHFKAIGFQSLAGLNA